MDGSLLVFSLATKEILFSQEKNNEIIGDIKYNPNSESLYTCSLNQTIIRYDLRSKQVPNYLKIINIFFFHYLASLYL